MSIPARYSQALTELRGAMAAFKPGLRIYDEIVSSRDQVFARYQPIFAATHVEHLTKEEFTSFLYIENNHHWSSLYRKGLGVANDLTTLRRALAILLDEAQPLPGRYSTALGMVTGLGKAIATAILTVAYPHKYGVWNNTSEAALRQLGIWPEVARGEGPGGRYAAVNEVLNRVANDLGIDLWALDALWWHLLEPDRPSPPTEAPVSADQAGASFALERQLQDFLLENWDRTPLAKDWLIYSTPDDPDAGNQFPTDVGRIDVLAVHKTKPAFLVIELKRNQTSDQTIGQALRYVGWVTRHLAQEGQTVEALVIAHKADLEARYALSTLTNVRMMTYEVAFTLRDLGPISNQRTPA